MQQLRPNQNRAGMAITLIWIIFALEIASLISGMLQYSLLQDISDGLYVSDEAAALNDLREQSIGILFLLAYIISAVTFIQWFRRAYYNLHQVVPYLEHGEGWAAGSWFIPVLGLVMPFRIMKELYSQTRAVLQKNGITGTGNLSGRYLGWWWAFWIGNHFAGQIIMRMSLDAETTAALSSATLAGLIGNILGIPLALLAIRVIKDYAAAEPFLQQIGEARDTSGPLQSISA